MSSCIIACVAGVQRGGRGKVECERSATRARSAIVGVSFPTRPQQSRFVLLSRFTLAFNFPPPSPLYACHAGYLHNNFSQISTVNHHKTMQLRPGILCNSKHYISHYLLMRSTLMPAFSNNGATSFKYTSRAWPFLLLGFITTFNLRGLPGIPKTNDMQNIL